ncbi:MAG: PLP-dependent aminotransferase family protein [Niabella sp.]|nr:PLP-dependent aminotransferase family protein [Niabella sp.]
MSSPVVFPWQTLIPIERNSATAVYLQITHQVINAIQRGYLPGSARLPGTRMMSALLGVHRKTIIAAYEELDAQGWIYSLPNKGTFIQSENKESSKKRKLGPFPLNSYPSKTGFHFTKSNLLDISAPASQPYVFTDGQPDSRLSPTDQLARYYTATLRRKINRRHLGYTVSETGTFYKAQLSNYLNQSRGLHIAPKNILTTRGMEMSMYVAASTLLSKEDVVLVGALGYYKANMIFQQAGAQLKAVPIDKEGVDVDIIERLCKKQNVRMLYLTPHHHYPTTVTLSARRRIELLQLANTYGFIILEDDYEYDFHYQTSPILPLASADEKGMVVYLGSFGKTLAPGFRTGFLVAPENLIAEMQKVQAIIDQQGDSITEQVLGELIAEGEIHRHLKKTQKIYQQRRDHFCETLKSNLGNTVSFTTPPGGLAVWTEWDPALNLLRVSKACTEQGIQLPSFLLYQTQQLTAARLGFGNFTTAEATVVLKLLKTAAQQA